MQTPVYTIAQNAGVEGAVVVGKLLESDNPDLGYDAAKGQFSKRKKKTFHVSLHHCFIFIIKLNCLPFTLLE